MEVKERVALITAMQEQLKRLTTELLTTRSQEWGSKHALDLLCTEFGLHDQPSTIPVSDKLTLLRNLVYTLRYENARLKDEWPNPPKT